jgi:hypothetical protein
LQRPGSGVCAGVRSRARFRQPALDFRTWSKQSVLFPYRQSAREAREVMMRKSSILIISVFVIVVLWASWPIHPAIVVLGIPAILVIIWGAKKANTPLSVEFGYVQQDLQDFQEASKNRTHREKRKALYVYFLFIIYVFLFMVPDSSWLGMGVNIPEKNNLPGFVRKTMELSSFPVSVYIFWIVMPFFMFLELCIICYFTLFVPWTSVEYGRFLAVRERKNAQGSWNHMLVMCFFMFILFPLCIVLDPSAIEPSSTIVAKIIFKTLKIYQNKLSFILFFGSYITLFIPLAMAFIVNECRFRFFHMNHRRM